MFFRSTIHNSLMRIRDPGFGMEKSRIRDVYHNSVYHNTGFRLERKKNSHKLTVEKKMQDIMTQFIIQGGCLSGGLVVSARPPASDSPVVTYRGVGVHGYDSVH